MASRRNAVIRSGSSELALLLDRLEHARIGLLGGSDGRLLGYHQELRAAGDRVGGAAAEYGGKRKQYSSETRSHRHSALLDFSRDILRPSDHSNNSHSARAGTSHRIRIGACAKRNRCPWASGTGRPAAAGSSRRAPAPRRADSPRKPRRAPRLSHAPAASPAAAPACTPCSAP